MIQHTNIFKNNVFLPFIKEINKSTVPTTNTNNNNNTYIFI